MADRQHQIENIEKIFAEVGIAPVLKQNPKHETDGVPRIGYDDVMNYKCVIKCDNEFPASGGFWSGKDAPVISEYESVEALVDDGWRLD